VVRSDVPRLGSDDFRAEPQAPALATHAPPLEREHGRVDWHRPARAIHDQVRGLAPRPGAFTTTHGKTLRLTKTGRVARAPALAPGEVRVERPRVLVGAGEGAIELVRAQLEGKKELDALSLVNGRTLADGDVLGG
jgi:methionyl-tRNA formyltransferase